MKYFFFGFFIVMFIFVPLFVGAQTTPRIPLSAPCSSITGEKTQDLCEFIVEVGRVLRIFAFLLAIIIVVISGIQYLTAGGDQTKLDRAKKTLTYGLVGVAIILAAYFLVGFIQDFLRDQDLTILLFQQLI